MIRPLIVAALLVFCVPAAFAEETAPDQALECHDNGLHYVIGVPAADGSGMSYRVGSFTRPDQVNPCSLDAPYGREFTADDGNRLTFLSLSDDLLMLTESTGPEYFLEVYNLEPEPILKVGALDVENSELGVHYYEPVGAATPQTCPRYDELTAGGMGAIIGEERFFPFSTGQVVPGKGTRCYQAP